MGGNVPFNDLKHDSEKALGVLIDQHETDPKIISLIGHNEGTMIAPSRIDNPTKVENVTLMGK